MNCGYTKMGATSSPLTDRLNTVHSDCPHQIRTEVIEAMLDQVSGHAAMFFKTVCDEDQRYYTSAVICGDDRQLIQNWLFPYGQGPALDAPWFPEYIDTESFRRFLRVRSHFDDDDLLSYEVNRTVILPAQVGDQLRNIVCDGDRFLGWIGMFRRGRSERFRKDEEESLNLGLPAIRAALAAAESLEREQLDDELFAVVKPNGDIEHASKWFRRWLTPDLEDYLRRRIVATDRGEDLSLFHSGGKIRVVRLDGAKGVRYLVTVDRAELLQLDRLTWLTDRQREIAEFAAAGATTTEIADTLGLSQHTIKTHIKNIYTRLGISSRLELADLFE